ncbi:Uncharacterized conserved protein YciI, contains a putative active-site phosphohistidine [Marininema mesophilum]|uniref:Uncharacterized conserved protein YciI, contains a putative active-site phosphohistidine n=1 Tax=Marininema mesophilum TaxID=1048340 RepID=A0A1H3CWE3_9BACL|nr:YciI family protein [Marininema mesophilum]SDX57769.1 Uncharacterized conserved protein YciI, contains a putative active-site phosphohistidine [Marininema mesophilum]
MGYSVIYFTQGANWNHDKPVWEQDLSSHQEYWSKYRLAENKVLAAGPFMDHMGGMIILEIEDMEEATELAKNDPAVTGGIFNYKVHPWNPLSKKF